MGEILIPNDSKHDVATFEILLGDAQTAMNPAYQVLSVSIVKEINRIPVAKIVIRDGDASERTFEISESDDFLPGKKIQINIGLDGDNNKAFKGIITRHAIKVKESGHSELIVECRDEAVKMTIGRHSRYFEKKKDSQVFDEIVGNYSGLSAEPEATRLEHRELVQPHVSDWDFMLLRAEANGMLVIADDGVIKIAKPKTNAKPALNINYGSSVMEFEAEMEARTQWKSVKAFSWDYPNQKLFEAEASEASAFAQLGNVEGSTLATAIDLENYEMRHSGHVLEQELQAWVDGIILRSRLAKIRGRAKVTGFSAIKPGDMVSIEGVGDRFNGNAFVTGVRQDIGNGMWDTHIQFGLEADPYSAKNMDLNYAATGGLAGAIHGLQVGKVVKLESDPEGQHRVQVKIPLIDNNAQGIWTRVASLDAGADRGAFFRPEINDEVIVGFINDDPRDAVLLGMLHSSTNPAPITAKDVNHEKGFTTRSKMHIHFNDDTKTITIDTPAGNIIKLDEAGKKIEITDQNKNTVTMDAKGIKMDSPKNIDINAGVNLTIKAGAQLQIGAASISVKADGNLGLEGALAKLAATGITEVSGSLVKIN
jgi:Rhs element Vgr protein